MLGVGGTRWTQPEIRSAPPEVLDAARWLLFAERVWPGPTVEAELFADEEPTKAQVKAARRQARTRIHEIRKLLLPPDEVE